MYPNQRDDVPYGYLTSPPLSGGYSQFESAVARFMLDFFVPPHPSHNFGDVLEQRFAEQTIAYYGDARSGQNPAVAYYVDRQSTDNFCTPGLPEGYALASLFVDPFELPDMLAELHDELP